MKKFLTVLIVLAFVASTAFAATPTPDYTNVIYQMASGTDKTEAPMVVVPVRYAGSTANDPGLVSGETVMYDTNSADGIAVVKCTLTGCPAGVLVTDVASSDGGGAINPIGRNNGYMCVKGYCLASMDGIYSAGVTVTKSTQFVGSMQGYISTDAASAASRDVVGMLLQASATKGSQYPIILF